ncbi:hypothetical protein [Alloactinosynnema sp. L-07]|uniref:hypothetical protein n=1 Tax=Alloactinosynnema sp. L-07 TaxID=1653480 RepID=UPI00065F063B|nr:hypothetical protein [Alloactinosynnema sp. L-07]CRK61395.1 hypothetical protein [Alloactinosynnema sp. L-07]
MIGLEDTDVATALAMLAAKAPQVSAAIVREDLTVEQVDALLAILTHTRHHMRELRFRWFGVLVEPGNAEDLS